jgi:PAS domain S-box-containing protein
LRRAKSNSKRAPSRPRTMLQALIEGAPDLLTLIDRDRIVRYVSPAVTRITGYRSRDLLGRPFADMLHPDDIEAANAAFDELLTSRDLRKIQTRFRHRDGHWIMLESLGRLEREVGGREAVLVSSRDITQHAQLEATLRKSAQESAELFEEAPCGYHAVDANDVLQRVNRLELRWLQRTAEELVGLKMFADLLVPASREPYRECFERLKKEGALGDTELEVLRKDGTSFDALSQSVAIRTPKGEFIGSRTTLYDTTERKAAERVLHRVNRALLILAESRKQIICARTEFELLAEICHIVVERGGYPIAAAFFALHDADSSMRLVAKAGADANHLESVRITWGDDERGQGPTGRAVRTGSAQVNRDFLTDPTVAPWRDAAVAAGARSSLSLPLTDGSGTFGVLNVYAGEADAFDVDELALLQELANETSFAIGSLHADEFAAEHAAHRGAEAHRPAGDQLARLSPREREVLKAVAEGRTSKQIAAMLGIAPASVDTYRSRLVFKLKVKGVTGLVRFAVRAGIVPA